MISSVGKNKFAGGSIAQTDSAQADRRMLKLMYTRRQMDGLRFECQPGCTNCCRAKGFVYITEDDLRHAAAYLGMKPADFEGRYVFRTRYLLRLRKPRNSQCHFLRDYGCSSHPAKPTQCRL